MDTEIKHTPGPWRIYEQPITDKDEAKRELCRMVDGTPNFQPVLVYVTDDEFVLSPAVTGCGERSIANARLIAAAPDLLAHAKADLAELEYYVGNPSAWDRYDDSMSRRLEIVVQRARTAIAKAEVTHAR